MHICERTNSSGNTSLPFRWLSLKKYTQRSPSMAATRAHSGNCDGNSEFPSATSSRVTVLGSSPLILLELCGNFVPAALPPPESMLSLCQSAVVKRERREREREREIVAGVRGRIAQRIHPFRGCVRASVRAARAHEERAFHPSKICARSRRVIA